RQIDAYIDHSAHVGSRTRTSQFLTLRAPPLSYVSGCLSSFTERVQLALFVDESGLLLRRHGSQMQSATKMGAQGAQLGGAAFEAGGVARLHPGNFVARGANDALERPQERSNGLQIIDQTANIHGDSPLLSGENRKPPPRGSQRRQMRHGLSGN